MCVSAGVGAGIGALVGGGIELYKQTGGFKNWGNLNGRALAVEAGRGALVGALAGLGASGAGALATSAGATTTGVAATEVVGGAYATGVGTFSTGAASDLAKGTPEKSVGAYGREAVNAGVGAIAGGAAGKAVGAVSSVIVKSNAATVAGGVAARAVEETTSATVPIHFPAIHLHYHRLLLRFGTEETDEVLEWWFTQLLKRFGVAARVYCLVLCMHGSISWACRV